MRLQIGNIRHPGPPAIDRSVCCRKNQILARSCGARRPSEAGSKAGRRKDAGPRTRPHLWCHSAIHVRCIFGASWCCLCPMTCGNMPASYHDERWRKMFRRRLSSISTSSALTWTIRRLESMAAWTRLMFLKRPSQVTCTEPGAQAKGPCPSHSPQPEKVGSGTAGWT